MASSGSYDLSVSGDDIIEAAMKKYGGLAIGESASTAEKTAGRLALNMLVKQWMAPPNAIAPGLKMWQRTRTSLTLTAAISITLKPGVLAYTSGGTTEIVTGDTLSATTGGSGATATVVAVSLASGTWAGGTAAGNFSLVGQSGTFASETVNNTGGADDYATISGDSDQAGGGKDIIIPVDIISAVRRDSNNNDVPMIPMLLGEFEALSNKTSNTGDPSKYYYERGLASGILRWNVIPSDTTKTVELVYLEVLEDFDAAANTPDFPQEWYRALVWNLAIEIISEDGKEPSAFIIDMAKTSLYTAQTFVPETSKMHFQPGLDDDEWEQFI